MRKTRPTRDEFKSDELRWDDRQDRWKKKSELRDHKDETEKRNKNNERSWDKIRKDTALKPSSLMGNTKLKNASSCNRLTTNTEMNGDYGDSGDLVSRRNTTLVSVISQSNKFDGFLPQAAIDFYGYNAKTTSLEPRQVNK